jgi:hypothetical protein
MDPKARKPLPWPPAVHAILWLDAVLVFGAALALGGMPPELRHDASAATWMAIAGSTLTAALGALSAFELCAPRRNRAWLWLPVPALALWLAGSGLGCLGVQESAELWGDTPDEAGRCLAFLLGVSAPLFAVILLMLWRFAQPMPARVLAMGGLASAGAAASLLALVHPHDAPLLDIGVHALALVVLIGTGALAARFRTPG